MIVDTRENLPYQFEGLWDGPAGRSALIDVPVVRQCLPVGDYSVLGHPGILVERKSKEDLYGSISQARENFEGRLVRMHQEYDCPWVLVEAEWQELLTAPPDFSKFSPKSLTRTILAWMVRYDRVHWLMAPSRAHAEAFCFRLMERYVKENESIDRACRNSPVRPGDLEWATTANRAVGDPEVEGGRPEAGATATVGDASPPPGPTGKPTGKPAGPTRATGSRPRPKAAAQQPTLLDAETP